MADFVECGKGELKAAQREKCCDHWRLCRRYRAGLGKVENGVGGIWRVEIAIKLSIWVEWTLTNIQNIKHRGTTNKKINSITTKISLLIFLTCHSSTSRHQVQQSENRENLIRPKSDALVRPSTWLKWTFFLLIFPTSGLERWLEVEM